MKTNKKRSLGTWPIRLMTLALTLLFWGCSQAPPKATTSPTPNETKKVSATATPAATSSPDAEASDESGEWSTVELADGLLSIDSPAPFTSEETADSTSVYATSDEKYGVIVTESEEMEGDPEAALVMVKDMVIQSSGGEETSFEKTTFDDHPAVRFSLDVVEEGEKLPVEVFSVLADGQYLVQLIVNDGDHEKFFDSLELHLEDGDDEAEDGDAEDEDEDEEDED